jgi:hypothetical protein
MVKVFFETKNGYCEFVALFKDEDVYIHCLEYLEEKCRRQGFDYVTETIIQTNTK